LPLAVNVAFSLSPFMVAISPNVSPLTSLSVSLSRRTPFESIYRPFVSIAKPSSVRLMSEERVNLIFCFSS
jgi:hypothetical protein